MPCRKAFSPSMRMPSGGFAKTVASAQRFSTSPAKASLTILRAVRAPRPRTRYLIGTDAKLSAFLKRNLPDRWMDAIIFWMFGLPLRVKHQEGFTKPVVSKDSNAPTGIEAV